MEKTIRSYETLFVLDAALTEEETAALIAKFSDLISSHGTIEKVDEWGKRKLAYEINKKNEGYYVLVNFKSGVEFPKELERIFRITDGVMRAMTVCTD